SRGEQQAMKKKLKLFKKILVPTDFSPQSEKSLDHAVMIANQFAAKIFLLHVIEPFPYTTTDAFMVVDNSEAMRSIAESLIKNLDKTLRQRKISAKTDLVVGNTTQEIIMKAEREKIDLIVMGTHGRTGLEHVLLGSVAEKVVRLATCPVLTIR
ncbi:MAG: universal stress protein, partial [Nitrospiria bacterium]